MQDIEQLIQADGDTTAAPVPTQRPVSDRTKRYIENSKAQATRTAYQKDIGKYTRWCEQEGIAPFPADVGVVADLITYMAEGGRDDGRPDGHKAATIRRILSTISRANAAAGYGPISTRYEPLHSAWQGVLRTIGEAQTQKAPL